jgi:cytochrome c
MKISIYILFPSATLLSGTAFAVDDLALAKEKQCLSCHSVEKDKFGPSVQHIALKYKDRKDAEAVLEKQILNGSGRDHWGTKMPPAGDPGAARTRPDVTKTEAKQLVAWVLSQK